MLFFDCTTRYFESISEDELKQNGFSKDHKSGQPQVLLALMVTRDGLPVSYEVFPGATYGGHSFLPVLRDMWRRNALDRAVCVADRGMFGEENLAELEAEDCGYIVGARIKNLPRTVQDRILDADAYQPMEGRSDIRVMECLYRGRRLLVTWSPVRARKDRRDRLQAVEKLRVRLRRSHNPKDLICHQGHKRFITVDGNAHLVIDEAKIQQAARWDNPDLGQEEFVRTLDVFRRETSVRHPEAFKMVLHRGRRQIERICRHEAA